MPISNNTLLGAGLALCLGAAPLAGHGASPAPQSPYPFTAAGWGPELGNGLMASRWAEDWRGMRQAGLAPDWKAMPLGGSASLTLSGEGRLRFDAVRNAQLQPDKSHQQGLLRGVAGADVRIDDNWRLYGELGTAQVRGQRTAAAGNFQNALSLQQAFVEARTTFDGMLLGAIAGRQEFGDGPRQLVSLSDGPNLHRTWNGTRLYLHAARVRLGAFSLRATRLGRGGLDEKVSAGDQFAGLNAGLVLAAGAFLEPFWYATRNPAFRLGARQGKDERDTAGVRLWGQTGRFRYDWTAAYQNGTSLQRPVRAWGVFAVQSFALGASGWKPRATTRIDIASGGGTYGSGTVRAFNQLYASSSYLGEGQFLSLSNLLMVSPGLALSPSARASLSVEYGLARRYDATDPVYAGGMRTYAGTEAIAGRRIGALVRVAGTWAVHPKLTLFVNYEDLRAGEVLRHARRASGRYLNMGATFRY